jgi:uncharacterized protein (UPF0276 family)
MKKSCLYCQKEFNGRIDRKYCSDTCKKYYNRWAKGIQKTPFKCNLNNYNDMVLLLDLANIIQNRGIHGNSVAEEVIRAIELRHFDIIHISDKRYLLRKYFHRYDKNNPAFNRNLTEEEFNKILYELSF